jgi:uncharacterized membrane-anchored protein
VVEGDFGEQVVNDVVVNDFVEEVASDEAESTVDGTKGTLDEGPSVLIVMRNVRVGVVKVGNCN